MFGDEIRPLDGRAARPSWACCIRPDFHIRPFSHSISTLKYDA